MPFRLLAIALNTFRENVRARLLHGLFALAVATAGYALIVGAYAFRDTLRVISDLGGASISIYGIVVAIVLGASSLYRELELKTAFPILARPISRSEYLIGKFLGTWLTLLVFVGANGGLLLLALAVLGGGSLPLVLGGGTGVLVMAIALAFRYPRTRTYASLVLALGWLVVGYFAAAVAQDDRQVLLGSMVLALGEIAIVVAVANLFASFTSPFLTAMLTMGVVVVGRSADTLARLPERVFGAPITELAKVLSRLFPNLMTYVPARPLLTGELPGSHLGQYLAMASAMSLGYCAVLLAIAALLFRRRDFT